MADNYTSASFQFDAIAGEGKLLEAVCDVIGRLEDEPDAEETAEILANLGPQFLVAFPPTEADAPFSGLLAIFDDANYPVIGADTEFSDGPEEGVTSCWFGGENIEPDPIAELIFRCCPKTVEKEPIAFEWATHCSKLRIGEFGGGYVVIFKDGIEIAGTSWLMAQMMIAKEAKTAS